MEVLGWPEEDLRIPLLDVADDAQVLWRWRYPPNGVGSYCFPLHHLPQYLIRESRCPDGRRTGWENFDHGCLPHPQRPARERLGALGEVKLVKIGGGRLIDGEERHVEEEGGVRSVVVGENERLVESDEGKLMMKKDGEKQVMM